MNEKAAANTGKVRKASTSVAKSTQPSKAAPSNAPGKKAADGEVDSKGKEKAVQSGATAA